MAGTTAPAEGAVLNAGCAAMSLGRRHCPRARQHWGTAAGVSGVGTSLPRPWVGAVLAHLARGPAGSWGPRREPSTARWPAALTLPVPVLQTDFEKDVDLACRSGERLTGESDRWASAGPACSFYFLSCVLCVHLSVLIPPPPCAAHAGTPRLRRAWAEQAAPRRPPP